MAGTVDALVRTLSGLFGVGFLWLSVSLLRQGSSILGQSATRIEAASEGDTVAADGTVRRHPDDPEAVEAPISEQECVLSVRRVEEFVGHELAEGSGWTDRASGVVATPFSLRSEGRTVTVDVHRDEELLETEFDLSGLDSPVETVDGDADPPPAIRRFERDHEVPERSTAGDWVPTSEDGPTEGDRRYYEAAVSAGDPLFVLGTVTGRDAGGIEVSDREGGELLLSDSGREGAFRDRAFGALVLGSVGIGLLWYGLAPVL